MPLALSRTGIYSVDPETQQTLAGLGLPMLSAPSGA